MDELEEAGPRIDWKRVALACLHPTQVAILRVMADGERHAPVDMATVLGEELGKVSYHVASLRKRGLIELASTEPRRGAAKHFYKLSV